MSVATKTPPRTVPAALETLVDRFDPDAFDLPGDRARIRLSVPDTGDWDAVIEAGEARLEESDGGRPDALLVADERTWRAIARDVAGGMEAFRARRLEVRHNLHLGVGFLAATADNTGPGRLRFSRISTRAGDYSVIEAGTGKPVLMLHGLGGTKASFLPTIRRSHRAFAPSRSTCSASATRTSRSAPRTGRSSRHAASRRCWTRWSSTARI